MIDQLREHRIQRGQEGEPCGPRRMRLSVSSVSSASGLPGATCSSSITTSALSFSTSFRLFQLALVCSGWWPLSPSVALISFATCGVT